MAVGKVSKLPRVTIEHILLKSENATFAALLNELLMWGKENGVSGETAFHLIRAFERSEPKEAK